MAFQKMMPPASPASEAYRIGPWSDPDVEYTSPRLQAIKRYHAAIFEQARWGRAFASDRAGY